MGSQWEFAVTFDPDTRTLANYARSVGKALQTDMRQAYNEAVDVLVVAVRQRAARLGTMETEAAKTVRAASRQRAAVIKYAGLKSRPYARGAEFGAEQERKHRRANPIGSGFHLVTGHRQFAPWKGTQGRFFYPTLRDPRHRDEVADRIADAVQRAIDRHWPAEAA